jgi:phosphoglycolate phosphatase
MLRKRDTCCQFAPRPAGGRAPPASSARRLLVLYTRAVADAPRYLVLFDIDGTLISTGGRAGRALAAALEETFGTTGPHETFRYSGKTDPQIVLELMSLAGVPREVVTPRLGEVFRRYLATLETALWSGGVRVLPGVTELLEGLAGRSDVALGLLTGNIAAGAAIKLRAAGLAGRFTVGAYGSDDADRDRLVPIARARAAERWGGRFDGQLTVVIGDAEADVRCARAGGARAVAVASGWTTREELAALEPDALLSSLAPELALPVLFADDTRPS